MMKPFDYQEVSIEHLLSVHKSNPLHSALNGSDTGTGKTLTAIEVMRRRDNPATLIVTPKIVIPSWHRTAAAQGVDCEVINWEMLRTGRTPFGIWRVPKGKMNPRFYFHKGIEFLIFDEVQRAKGMDSDNSDMLRAARRCGIPSLSLSATPADSPMELDALGYTLGLHDGDDKETLNRPNPVSFPTWARARGCGKSGFQPLAFIGQESDRRIHMERIHRELYPAKGHRVKIADLGDAFPETQITAELYELEDPNRVAELQSVMAAALLELHTRAAFDKNPEHPMTVLLRARQELELMKVPVFVELTRDMIASGMSVLIFVNFRATLQELCRMLETDCFIDGTQTGPSGAARREANRMRLQTDQSRVLVGVSEAAGVGMDAHDVTGKHPRGVLISPGFSAKTTRQLVGRVCRAGGRSKSLQRFIFATGEEGLHETLSRKLNCLDTLNDADLEVRNLLISARF